MGYVPDWYEVVEASKYLGVAPWELVKQPLCWREWALMAKSVDAKVNEVVERAKGG